MKVFIQKTCGPLIQRLPPQWCRPFSCVPYLGKAFYSRYLSGYPQKESGKAPHCYVLEQKKTVHILDAMHIQHGKGMSFAGKKVALVAHWDPQACIDPYVCFYARALKDMGYAVVLTSDRELQLTEASLSCFDAIIWRSCLGYDFTSWKGALEKLPSLALASELIFTNDSIFGPIHSLYDVHTCMNALQFDFWGLSSSNERQLHLQSFYLVFRKNIIQSTAFKLFWDHVGTSEDKEYVIDTYEVKLTSWFQEHGFVAATYVTPEIDGFYTQQGPVYMYWRKLLHEYRFPFVKRDVIAGKNWWIDRSHWKQELQSYPVQLITDYMERIRATIK